MSALLSSVSNGTISSHSLFQRHICTINSRLKTSQKLFAVFTPTEEGEGDDSSLHFGLSGSTSHLRPTEMLPF